MPNFFKNSGKTVVKNTAEADPIAEVVAQPLGFFQNWKLNSARSQARLELELTNNHDVSREAMAISATAAAFAGAQCRLAIASEHATVMAALADETQTAHTAMLSTLGSNRFAGSYLNIESRNDMLAATEKLLAAGKISQDDARSLYQTAGALHGEIEQRIDENFNRTIDMVDGVFRKATVGIDVQGKRAKTKS